MTESADKVFTNSVRKQSRRGSSWVHPAPHTNDPHIVNRILSPRSKVRRELMSNYSSREIVRSPGDAPTTNSSSPTSDFLIKGKSRPFRAQSEYTLSMGHLRDPMTTRVLSR